MGPLLGGLVFDKLGYNAVFVMAYLLIFIDIILRLVAIERNVARKWLNEEPVTDEVEMPQQTLRERLAHSDEAGVLENQTETAPDQTLGKRTPSVVLLLLSPSFLVSLWGSVVLAIVMTSLDAVLPLYVK